MLSECIIDKIKTHMKIYGKTVSMTKLVCLCLYYSIARFLPSSHKFGNLGGEYSLSTM